RTRGRGPAFAVVRAHGGSGSVAGSGPPACTVARHDVARAVRFVPVAPGPHAAAVGVLLSDRDLRAGAPAQPWLLQSARAAQWPARRTGGCEDAKGGRRARGQARASRTLAGKGASP